MDLYIQLKYFWIIVDIIQIHQYYLLDFALASSGRVLVARNVPVRGAGGGGAAGPGRGGGGSAPDTRPQSAAGLPPTNTHQHTGCRHTGPGAVTSSCYNTRETDMGPEFKVQL